MSQLRQVPSRLHARFRRQRACRPRQVPAGAVFFGACLLGAGPELFLAGAELDSSAATDPVAQHGESGVTTPPAVPQAHPEDRYHAAWQRSPFERKTAPTVVTGRQANFADELELISLMRRDGRLSAQVKDRATGAFIRVTEVPDADGMHIVDATLARDPRAQAVTLAKGNQTGVVRRAGSGTTAAATPGGGRGAPGLRAAGAGVAETGEVRSRVADPSPTGAPRGVPPGSARADATGGSQTGRPNTGDRLAPAAGTGGPARGGGDSTQDTRPRPDPDSRRRIMVPGGADGSAPRGRVIRVGEDPVVPGEPLQFHIQMGDPSAGDPPSNPAAPLPRQPAGGAGDNDR